MYRNYNVWKFQNAIKAAEIFIFADDRNELEEKTSGGPNVYLKYLLKDSKGEYIVSDSLTTKPDAENNHSLIVIQSEIDSKLSKLKQRSTFNIGDELQYLTEAPYGIYTNMPNMALLGFALRDYIGEIYAADVGRPIEKDEMRDLVGYMFSYWQEGKNQNKLKVRFGSKEERELKKIFSDLFDLKECNSITDTRWAIIDYLKTVAKFPIWALKYYSKDKGLSSVIDEILNLISNPKEQIDLTLISNVLEKIKDFKLELKLTLKPINFHIGFLKFLQSVDEGIKISEDNFDEITKYITESLQEEVGYWKEDEVKLRVYQWDKNKNKTILPLLPNPPDLLDDPRNPLQPILISAPEREAIIARIKNFNLGEQALKEKIVQLLEENPQLLSYFNKYFS